MSSTSKGGRRDLRPGIKTRIHLNKVSEKQTLLNLINSFVCSWGSAPVEPLACCKTPSIKSVFFYITFRFTIRTWLVI